MVKWVGHDDRGAFPPTSLLFLFICCSCHNVFAEDVNYFCVRCGREVCQVCARASTSATPLCTNCRSTYLAETTILPMNAEWGMMAGHIPEGASELFVDKAKGYFNRNFFTCGSCLWVDTNLKRNSRTYCCEVCVCPLCFKCWDNYGGRISFHLRGMRITISQQNHASCALSI